jgi:hypothetical protein
MENPTENSEPDSKKNIKESFDEQKKLFDYRYKGLLRYREDAKFVMENKPLAERFEEAIKNKIVETREITDEKLDNRTRRYGTNDVIITLLPIKKKLYNIILSGNKSKEEENRILFKFPYDDEKSKKENIRLTKEAYAEKGFDYEREYIPEDSERKYQADNNPHFTISYETYYRFGLFIYRMVDGKKYELIYQANYVRDKDGSLIISGLTRLFISYQWVIAQIKQDVLNKTGLTLEEWIYLSKTRKDIFVEGGIKYKRTRYQYDDREGKYTDIREDYRQEYEFG